MNRRELLRSQKAQIFQYIVESGLSPTDFKWESIPSGDIKIERLIHSPTDSFFVFDFNRDDYGWNTFSPARDMVREQVLTEN